MTRKHRIPCCAAGQEVFQCTGRSLWSAGTRNLVWRRSAWNLSQCEIMSIWRWLNIWIHTQLVGCFLPTGLKKATHDGDLVFNERNRPQGVSGVKVAKQRLRAQTHVARKRSIIWIQDSWKTISVWYLPDIYTTHIHQWLYNGTQLAVDNCMMSVRYLYYIYTSMVI